MTTSPSDPHDPIPRTGPNPVSAALRTILKPLASLQLTVVLLSLGVVLVFFGTLAQKTSGLWTVVDQYFWSWIVMIDLQPTVEFAKIFFGLSKESEAPTWAKFPFPGGKLIGGLMFLNLLAAHTMRFKLTWKRAGIWMAHGGLLLLFVGEAITREFQVEQRMTIQEGEAVNFTEDHRLVELAFGTPDEDGTIRTTVIPGTMLQNAARNKTVITHPDLPVDIRVDRYMANSNMLGAREINARKAEGMAIPENPATAGLGLTDLAESIPEVSGVGDQQIDLPSAYITLLRKGTEEKLGTYLVSLWYTFNPFDRGSTPDQSVAIDGTTHDFTLRYTRYYKPFSLYLRKFSFDRYTGTQQAKNYSSDLTLVDPEREQSRDVRVAMNDPLRYRGETFYQSNFDKTTEKTTILQVVRNPGWILPYVACVMVSIGLLFHFLLGLTSYLTKQKKAAVPIALAAGERPSFFERALPWLTVGLASLMLAGAAAPKTNRANPAVPEAARLPVVDGGRIKPLDTVARVYLRRISAREQFVNENGVMRPAIEWLLDAMASPLQTGGPAWKHKVIRIENDQVLSLMGLERREGYRYSLDEVAPKIGDLQKAMDKAKPRPGMGKQPEDARINEFFESGDRDVFAAKVIETAERIELYTKLCAGAVPLALPPANGKEWRSLGDVQQQAQQQSVMAVLGARGLLPKDLRELSDADFEKLQAEGELKRIEILGSDPSALQFIDLINANKAGNPDRFTQAITEFRAKTAGTISPADQTRVNFEVFLNEFAPAYEAIKLFVFAGLLTLAGWVTLAFRPSLGEAFRRSAFWLLVLTFVIHGFALIARMYLMDRPLVFVTNLYSTAVFIGWAAVALGLFVEKVAPIGLGNLAAAVVGGATAIIAHNLAASGDTLEMMQAVLDTNFWLATHVTTINLGYSATYVAGVVGVVYILFGVFTPVLSRRVGVGAPGSGIRGETVGRVLGQIMYGVICLAVLLSFVGTVLGGIWADQSWGRFWGWDPKENGAVLIVLWNALILHARWCGLVKDRGIAVLSLVGNMITTWSYFGTNQLSVGLHAYGFSKTLADWCKWSWLGHLALVGIGLIPTMFWRSFSGGTAQATTVTGAEALPTGPIASTPEAVNGTSAATTNGTRPNNGPGKGKHPGKKR